ncbi:MAG: VWA domain-containing protein [Gemmataceae bacterium]
MARSAAGAADRRAATAGWVRLHADARPRGRSPRPVADVSGRAARRLLAPPRSCRPSGPPARQAWPSRLLAFAPAAAAARRAHRPGRSTARRPAVWEWRPPLQPVKGADLADRPTVVPGRGRVVLVTTTLNSDWNRWPVSPAFPPLMQELLYYAAAPRLRERALTVGEPIEIYLTSTGSVDAAVEAPRDGSGGPTGDGDEAARRVTSQPFGDGSVIRFGDTDAAGVYKLHLGSAPQEHLFAVNVPAAADDQRGSESNLLRTTEDELKKTFPEWDLQVVDELRQVKHAQAMVETNEVVYSPQGGPIAHVLLLAVLGLVLSEVVLAWRFGHYTAAPTPGEQPVRRPGAKEWALAAAPWLLFAALGGVGFVLAHNAWTGDFLGFLPETARALVERGFDIPPPATGEGSRWRLEYSSYLVDPRSDPWLIGALVLALPVAIAFVYRQEGHDIRPAVRLLLVGLRVGLLALLLFVFLPQLKLHFERQGWPDVVLLIDDSQSMAAHDVYRDDTVKGSADALARRSTLTETEKAELAKALAGRQGVTPASRLRLAQTFLTGDGEEWLRTLLARRKVRLHVYRCSTRAQRLADVTAGDELERATHAITDLRADPAHDSSQLGTAVRQVLNDFRGASLAAVVMLTDGVTTEGEDLGAAGKYAAQMGVPLFFLGIGDAHETRDLFLHDLQAEDAVYVNDRIVFELRLTAQGYDSLTAPVALYEKGKDTPLDTRNVTVEANNRTVKVRLTHRPTEPGEKVFVVRTPLQPDESDRENNTIERAVHVREARQLKVLYVEGYRRYEYHYLKTLLERESGRVKGNKSVNLKVVLLDADADFATQDRTAIPAFPTPFRNLDAHTRDDDLWSYDVVILGDIDPEPRDDNRMAENLKNLAEFVTERGGGLLVLAGERSSPRALRNSPLKDVLPIDITGERVADGDQDNNVLETYRPELTPIGRMHPIFRFSPDEKDNEEIWERLKEFYWFADGYVPKRAAEVLAVHPTLKAAGRGGEKHPLVLQQFAGAGRCMLFGFDEVWRWNWREDQLHYNQFWIQTVRYLARARLGRIDLRLDRQTPYRRGEPIKATVRFPDDDRPPPDKTEVKVVVERKVPGKPGDKETRTLQLSKVDGSRGTYETILTQTPEGDYHFWLSEPEAKPRPQADCKVLAPPGEMEKLRMNQVEMEQAAVASRGKFYTLASADRLIDELPTGARVTVTASGQPLLIWNLSGLFLLAGGLLTVEWLIRKQKNLL